MVKGLIACVIDEEIVRAIDSNRKNGQTAADLFVLRALRRLSANVKVVAAVERNSRTVEELIRLKPRIVVNLAFCSLSSEPSFAGTLETLGIPYTGSGPVGIGLANDKIRSRRLMASEGIRVPRFVELSPAASLQTVDFPPPYFVKPVQSGNSVGISASSLARSFPLALRQADRIWRTLQEPTVCDEFIAGREFHVGLIENARGNFKTAGLIELRFVGAEPGRGFSTQISKVRGKHRRTFRVLYRLPSITPRKLREMSEIAVRVARLLQLRGYAKLDLRMDEEERITVVEANANPGLWDGEIWRRPSFERNLMQIMQAGLRKARE